MLDTDAQSLLSVAIEEAKAGFAEGGIPIGAALFTSDGKLLGRGHNRSGAVIVGESRTFQGGINWLRERGIEVIDLDSRECYDLLQSYIKAHPDVWNEDIGEFASPAPNQIHAPYP